MFNKKTIIYILVSILIISIGTTFAYFAQGIVGVGTSVNSSSSDLRIIFTDNALVGGTSISPGWTASKTFTVENKSPDSFSYDILIEDLINEFESVGYLQYQISSNDGGFSNSSWINVPQSSTGEDVALAENISIASNTIHSYTINFHYLNSATRIQVEDMGKTFSGKLIIAES